MINNVWGKLRTLSDQGVLDALVWMGGNLVYVDGNSGNDSGDGNIDRPKKTLESAYALLRSGMNDAIVIKSDGLTDASALSTVRLDAAFDWNKPATHLIGLNPYFAPLLFSPRARLAPTSTTTAFANFFTVSATGCFFRGVQWFHDFGTDTTAMIAVTVKGARNYFQRCHIVGCQNDDAAARSLVLSANASGNKGENVFDECTIGVDTVVRTQASAQIGLTGTQVPRNYFRDCIVLSWSTAGGVLMIKADASAIDRFVMFESCKFINFGTALTSLMSINATQNGKVLLDNCSRYNCGNFGDTANTLIVAPVVVNTGGLGTAPAA